MISSKGILRTIAFSAFLLWSPAVHACATCFGASDSKLAVAMNWGIMFLLLVITSVLGAIAFFFFFLAKRGARMELQMPKSASSGASQNQPTA